MYRKSNKRKRKRKKKKSGSSSSPFSERLPAVPRWDISELPSGPKKRYATSKQYVAAAGKKLLAAGLGLGEDDDNFDAPERHHRYDANDGMVPKKELRAVFKSLRIRAKYGAAFQKWALKKIKACYADAGVESMLYRIVSNLLFENFAVKWLKRTMMSALKRAIKVAKVTREPEPLRVTLQKVTPRHVPPGHPLVAEAEWLLRDLDDERRLGAAIAALQAAIVEAERTRAVMPLQYEIKACLQQRVSREHPVVVEALELLQLLQDEENARLLAETALLQAIRVAKRTLIKKNPSVPSIRQAREQLVNAKITAMKVPAILPENPIVQQAYGVIAELDALLAHANDALNKLRDAIDTATIDRDADKLKLALRTAIRDGVPESSDIAAEARALIRALENADVDAAAAKLKAATDEADAAKDREHIGMLEEAIEVASKAHLPEHHPEMKRAEEVLHNLRLIDKAAAKLKKQTKKVLALDTKLKATRQKLPVDKMPISILAIYIEVASAAGVPDKHPNMIYAKKVMQDLLKQQEAAIKKLEQATEQAPETGEEEPLEKAIEEAEVLGILEKEPAMVRAKEVLAQIKAAKSTLSDACDRARKRRVTKKLKKTIKDVVLSGALAAGSNPVKAAEAVIAEIENAVIAAAKALKRQTDQAQKSNDADGLTSAIDEAKAAGVPDDHPHMAHAKKVLEEILRALERERKAAAKLERAVKEARETHDPANLKKTISEVVDSGDLKRDSHPVRAAQAVVDELEAQRRNAVEKLRRASDKAEKDRRSKPLEDSIEVAKNEGVPDDHEEMTRAIDLLAKLKDEEERARAAAAKLEKAVKEARETQNPDNLKKTISEVVDSGDLKRDSDPVRAAQAVVDELESKMRKSVSKLRRATDKAEKDRRSKPLEDSIEVAKNEGVPDDHEEMKRAVDLLAKLKDGEKQASEAERRIKRAMEEAKKTFDPTDLENVVTEVLDSKQLPEDNPTVVAAKDLIKRLKRAKAEADRQARLEKLDQRAIRHDIHDPTQADKDGADAFAKFRALMEKDPEESKRKKRNFSRKQTKRAVGEQEKNEPDEEALLLAAEDNDVETIVELLDRGTNIDCVNEDGYTPLQVACNFGCAEAAKCLLERGAFINHVADDTTTPLLLVASAGHANVLDVLLNDNGQTPEFEAELDTGASAVYLAAQQGAVDCINKLVAAGANPDHAAKDGTTPVYAATREGHIPAVAELAQCADVNIGNNKGITPVYIAVKIDSEEAVKILLDHKANAVVLAKDGSTPVEAAIFHGNRTICDHIFDSGVNVNYVRASDGDTAVGLAAHVGHFTVAQDLFRRGANLKKQNNAGQIVKDIVESDHGISMAEAGLPDEEAMFIAAEDNDVDTIEYLIEIGTSVNCINEEDKYTPLMIAASEGAAESCEELLRNGAAETINQVGTDSSMALILAGNGGHAECCKLLLEADQAPDEKGALTNGATALYMATQGSHVECVKLLVKSGIAVNIPKTSKETPMYIAAHEGNNEIVEILLKTKADPNLCNNRGASPAYIAVQKCHPHTVGVLLDHKADPNLSTDEGSSPLMRAVFHCNPRLVKKLLDCGANVDQHVENGNTEAMMAAYAGDIDVLQILLQFGASCNLTNKKKLNIDDILRNSHNNSLWLAVEKEFNDKNHVHDEEHEDHVAEARKHFDELDDDGSGVINIDELRTFLEDFGFKELHEEKDFENFVETEFHRMNHDGDGEITFDEFKTCFTRFSRMKKRQESKGTTITSDKKSDGDGEAAEAAGAAKPALNKTKSLYMHKKTDGKLSLRPKIKNWYDLLLIEGDDGNWPIKVELRDGMPTMAKNRPTKDKQWLYITFVEKSARICGFKVGDIIMQVGSLHNECHSMQDFKDNTYDHGFAVVTVYRKKEKSKK